MSDPERHPTPEGIGRMLDLLAAILSVVFCLAAAGYWLFALLEMPGPAQIYFDDFGIKAIYLTSALLSGFLATILIRRLERPRGEVPTLVANRLLVLTTVSVAALPWAELLYARSVVATSYSPSIWNTTNFGALGSLALMFYLVFRIPLLTLVRERESSLRLVLVVGGVLAIVAVYLYLKL